MQISEVYKHLQNQHGCLAGMEQRVQGLLNTNVENLQKSNILKLSDNREDYFRNQHECFNVLMEVVGDMKIVNSYALFEIECQLRENVKN